MSERDQVLRRLKAEFRGILLSAGHNGLTIPDLMRDYIDLNGRPIPLSDLGYSDIITLLINDMGDVCTFWQDDFGNVVMYPVSHESTRHIEHLIARQRVTRTSRFGSKVPEAIVGHGTNGRRSLIKSRLKDIFTSLRPGQWLSYQLMMNRYRERHLDEINPTRDFGCNAKTMMNSKMADMFDVQMDPRYNGQILVRLKPELRGSSTASAANQHPAPRASTYVNNSASSSYAASIVRPPPAPAPQFRPYQALYRPPAVRQAQTDFYRPPAAPYRPPLPRPSLMVERSSTIVKDSLSKPVPTTVKVNEMTTKQEESQKAKMVGGKVEESMHDYSASSCYRSTSESFSQEWSLAPTTRVVTTTSTVTSTVTTTLAWSAASTTVSMSKGLSTPPVESNLTATIYKKPSELSSHFGDSLDSTMRANASHQGTVDHTKHSSKDQSNVSSAGGSNRNALENFILSAPYPSLSSYPSSSSAVAVDDSIEPSTKPKYADMGVFARQILAPRFASPAPTVSVAVAANTSTSIRFPIAVRAPSSASTVSSAETASSEFRFKLAPGQQIQAKDLTREKIAASNLADTKRKTHAERIVDVKIPDRNREEYLVIKENVHILVDKYQKRGIDVAIFKAAYETAYNKRPNVQELFDMSWGQLLASMYDICYINEKNVVRPRTKNDDASTRNGFGAMLPPSNCADALPKSPSVASLKTSDTVVKWINESSGGLVGADQPSKSKSSFSSSSPVKLVGVDLPVRGAEGRNFVYAHETWPSRETDFQALMSHCNAPDDFYILLQKRQKDLRNLMNSINKFSVTGENFAVGVNELRPGLACLAWYEVGGWHRAIITTVYSKDETSVRYVDYGTVDIVPLDKLRHLPDEFKTLPALAVHCKLACLKPVDGQSFSYAACQRLLNLTLGKTFWISVIEEDAQLDILSVVLTTTDGDDDLHVNDQLIIENLAQIETTEENVDLMSLDGVLDDDDIISDADFGFESNSPTPEEKAEDVVSGSKDESIDWEEELGSLDVEDREEEEKASVAQASTSREDNEDWLLPDLETEVLLIKRAREMVENNKSSVDTFQIIRAVIGMKRTSLYKSLTMNASKDVVDKADWLERQMIWLDQQMHQPDDPNAARPSTMRLV